MYTTTITEEQFAFTILLLQEFGIKGVSGWCLFHEIEEVFSWFEDFRKNKKIGGFEDHTDAFFQVFRDDIKQQIKIAYNEK